MTLEEFDKIVAEALDDLPDEFIKTLNDCGISVTTQDDITEEQKQDWKFNLDPTRIYFGVFTGTPYTNYTSRSFNWPAFIYLFKNPIELWCAKTNVEIKVKIVKVLKHEIGHFLGLSEDKLRELDCT